MNNNLNLYRKMYLIREFETTLESYFAKGLLRGTTHACIGQEAIPVALSNIINAKIDFITSTHRGHGHYLAITEDVYGLACEIMGKEDGVVSGKGGSQHLHKDNFYTNGITGGMVPIGVGMAFSKKLKNEAGVVFSFLGDGGMNEGYVMEALNLASAFNAPIMFILENNNYAMSSDTKEMTGGTFAERIKSFGIMYKKIVVNDVSKLSIVFSNARKFIEENKKPIFIECNTFRFCGHSKSDKREYVKASEDDFWHKNDPLVRLGNKLGRNKKIIEDEVNEMIRIEFEKAETAIPSKIDNNA